MRFNLYLRGPGDRAILDFVGHHVAIEIWKVGSWYHWRSEIVHIRPGLDGPTIDRLRGQEFSGPNLPLRFQRFWNESPEVETEEVGETGTAEATGTTEAVGEKTSP
jgi:hypothetical protein